MFKPNKVTLFRIPDLFMQTVDFNLYLYLSVFMWVLLLESNYQYMRCIISYSFYNFTGRNEAPIRVYGGSITNFQWLKKWNSIEFDRA